MARHAEVVGGGYAGLTVAAALAQWGWSVRLHERAKEVRAFGAGIFLWENGLHVLRSVGAYEETVAGVHEAPLYRVRDKDGELLGERRFGCETGTRMLTPTRQHMHAALLRCVEARGVEVRTSSHVVGARPEGVVLTADGAEFEADLVVGADGTHSAVRDSLELTKSRMACDVGGVRLLLPRTPADNRERGDYDNVVAYQGDGYRRLLYVPCDRENLYLCFTTRRDDHAGQQIPVRVDDWSDSFPVLADILQRIGSEGRWDLYEVIKLKKWSEGRVAVIGDAAHAMTPALGQGAGCAMMNALSLAAAVSSARSIPDCLADWERRERPLTEDTQDLALKISETGSRTSPDGTKWDDDALKTARHVPTGAMAA